MKLQNVTPNPDYLDNEFAQDPSVMYTQEYIEAAYNPEVSTGGGVALTILLGIVIITGQWGTALVQTPG